MNVVTLKDYTFSLNIGDHREVMWHIENSNFAMLLFSSSKLRINNAHSPALTILKKRIANKEREQLVLE